MHVCCTCVLCMYVCTRPGCSGNDASVVVAILIDRKDSLGFARFECGFAEVEQRGYFIILRF